MTTDIDMTNANGAQAVNGVHIDEVRGVGDRLADFSDLVRPPSRAPLSRYSLVCTRACLSSARTYTLASWRSIFVNADLLAQLCWQNQTPCFIYGCGEGLTVEQPLKGFSPNRSARQCINLGIHLFDRFNRVAF